MNPSSWSSFVEGVDNPLICDTFLMQTFSGAATDNWDYTLSGTAKIDDPTPLFSDAPKNKALFLYAGSKVVFKPYSLDGYTNVTIKMLPALYQLTLKDTLFVDASRSKYPLNHAKLYWGKQDNQTLQFKDLKNKHSCYFDISFNPTNLTMEMSKKASSLNGFFVFDHLVVCGDIPTYSLFKGEGEWSNEKNWTHLPPQRKRIGLIEGNLTIDKEAHCRSLQLHNANLHFTNLGQLTLDDELCLYYTFPAKGKWFFFSLPFDVYPEDLDPEFTLKDESPNEGGNFLYVCRYDAQRRAEQQNKTGNWKVIKLNELQKRPLFEKNKGYLVALDEKATTTMLSFSTAGKELPKEWGHKASIFVESFGSDSSNEHAGWHLCGNPLPSELPLSAISDNTDLDGYIYLLEGNSYKPYKIGSNYAIPAYSAFFVRTKRETQIEIRVQNSMSNSYQTLKVSSPINLKAAEPSIQPTSSQTIEPATVHCCLNRQKLTVSNMPEQGVATIYDLSGKQIKQIHLPMGASIHSVVIPKGLYIINIHTDNNQWRFSLIHR